MPPLSCPFSCSAALHELVALGVACLAAKSHCTQHHTLHCSLISAAFLLCFSYGSSVKPIVVVMGCAPSTAKGSDVDDAMPVMPPQQQKQQQQQQQQSVAATSASNGSHVEQQQQVNASPPHVSSSPAVVSPRPDLLGAGSGSGGFGGAGRFGPPIPVSVLTDSYKASHFRMYPEAQLMVAYGEFRGSFAKDPEGE